ncbi:MAG: hypothetical protein JO244_11765, partial [Solirubrobacterales bacterium]|nr:hypothetical protein [Solirubrobacterales bacterium]
MTLSSQLKHVRRLVALVAAGTVVLTPVAAAQSSSPTPNSAYTTQGAW